MILIMSKINKKEHLEEVLELYSKHKSSEKVAEVISERYNVKHSGTLSRKIRSWVSVTNNTEKEKIEESSAYKKALGKKLKSKKRYIISWAQSNTPISESLLLNMESYAKEIDAEILITAGVYNNPNSKYEKINTIWDKRIIKYLSAKEHHLHKYLTIINDANVLATAERPLRGFEGITGDESSIIGHPRQHFEVVPTLPQSKEKMLFSTGSITTPNYRKARVGKKAEFHHQMGFLVVEIFDKDNFTARHVSALPDGSFQDLLFNVSKGVVEKNAKWEAIILGDLHLGKEDVNMLSETKRLISKMKPKNTICHDIFDGHSINHHASKDFVHQVLLEKKGENCLKSELEYMFKWIDDWKEYNLVIVPSNHNDWLDKWVRFSQGQKDIKNAQLFNNFQHVLFNEEAEKGLVAYCINQKFQDEVITLGRNDSFKVKGHELNNHGDLGSNGAKGTPTTFKKLNVKIVSGDKHFAYTLDGAYGVGISTIKDHGYNKGLSSWVKSHGVINENGKFQHLLYFDNKFTELI